MQNYWRFNEINNIEELSFHKVLEKFYDYGVEGLVRENIQNSLDGKLHVCDKPVSVKIETGKIHVDDIPGISNIYERVKALKGRNEYTNETILHMQKVVNRNLTTTNYISFEDSNTKGLSGAQNGQSLNYEDTWSAYAYSKGVHSIESDDNIEKSRGGSHGIGKIASNAASDLYIMYFANCDELGKKHLGGTVQLIEHVHNDKKYRATGYFTRSIDNVFFPYENNFHEIFNKNTQGLKIVIPFFREQFNDENKIIKSVCDNFFVAIIEGKLKVEVNGSTIDSQSIESFVLNPDYYPQELEENKTEFTPIYYSTYLNTESSTITISDLQNNKYNFKLFFRYDKRIQKGRVGIIRTVGMKIEDKKISGNVNKPFNAILIPVSVKEDSFLKSLENESHTELSHEHIKNQFAQKNAKRFINNLSKKIGEIIDEHIRLENPTDGLINTADVLYDIENNFKKDLNDSNSNLTINVGDKKKTIIKVKTHVKKVTKTPKDKEIDKKDKGTKKVIRDFDGDSKREFYKIKPNIVQRAILNTSEKLYIDLTHESLLCNKKSCDMYLAVIDGMGNEYMDEMLLNDAYAELHDIKTGSKLEIDEKTFKRVPIHDSVINLELKLSNNFNRTLKFSYYLEV